MNIQISIVITARNYAQYLIEAIDSCLQQTIKPIDIIYSDDYSTDNSIEVVKNKYKNKVTIIKQKEHKGVVFCRNAGAMKSKGNALIFLDGDDILTEDYIEKQLEVFSKQTPFVYSSALAFGTFEHLWKVQPFKEKFIWNRNFCNTSMLIWKDKFIECGMWQDTSENTMWDWSLAIRLSRLGLPVMSSAVLKYRQHNTNHSKNKGKNAEKLNYIINKVRKEIVKITIGVIYSGRLNENYFENVWLKQLIEDIKILHNKPQLIIINNSTIDKNFFTKLKKIYSVYFSEINIITGYQIEYTTEKERRNKVCQMLSQQYNRILCLSTGDLIHLREDDIIPNQDSFKNIYEYAINSMQLPNAVAGVYLNRNIDIDKIVGGYFAENDKTKEINKNKFTEDSFLVDFTGTGFLIFWKDICPNFEPYYKGIQAHDWNWGNRLQVLGGKLYMLSDAICKHYKSEKEFVEYKNTIKINKQTTFTKINNVIDENDITTNNNKCIIIK